MKKKFVPILLFMAVLFTLFSGVGQAASTPVVPKLYLNDQLLKPYDDPQIVNNYTLVPIRVVSENMGYEVNWSASTKTVTIHNGQNEIILTIDNNIALVNNQQVQMDMSAKLQKGRTTMIPVRFVSEQLGLTVKWEQTSQSVFLYNAAPEDPSTNPVETSTITSIQYDSNFGIIINYEGKMGTLKPFKLDSPKRIVIDFPNTVYSDVLSSQFMGAETRIPVTDNPYISMFRYSVFSTNPATARLVLDLNTDTDADTAIQDNGAGVLTIGLTDPATTPPGDPTPPPVTTDPGTKVYNVVIDAGHGGTDPGAKSINGRWEKEVNLSLSLKVKALLDKEKYIKPLLSRPEDKFVTLADRVTFAKNNKADIFISIHANSNPTSSVTGTETYYTRDSSKALANIVHKHLVKGTGLKDRGVKYGNLHVTRETTMPAILLETGFLSNKGDSDVLYSDAAQNKMAAEIVAGIKEYLKLS
ncbi:N-acetylmuramoyl-L-alanine amidase family protein [Paenibacillus glycanilyticus]|uniref:N-acetylmuramoyl-L-alanine amidase family protein n=1 Tax=Paenibacillus glycanilyticus TaxID=126569 RepID=UPI00203CBE14|nr:N-acetylmuramoyl-L-alanine amidase family protein [Paenibacillus glycanilyticus]MCM3627524.1 N-acetylmuramoyl-L-alanine amidase family protein [Paenibacillus glycanilyticus]